jgi:hypothetical protein
MHAGGPFFEPPAAPRMRVSRRQARAAGKRLNGPGYKDVPAAERVALHAVVQARHDTIGRRGGWLLLAIILILAAGALIFGSVSVGPAFRAARAQGTHGVFIARHFACDRLSCRWDGPFESAAGRVLIRDVTYGDAYRGMRAGSAVPALYSGDHGYVFAPHGSSGWIEDVMFMVLGGAVLLAFLWRGPVSFARRRGRDRRIFGEMIQT